MTVAVTPEDFAARVAGNHGVPVVRRASLRDVLEKLDPERQLYYVGSTVSPVLTAVPFSVKHLFGVHGTREIRAKDAAVCQHLEPVLERVAPWARNVLIELVDPYTIYGFCGERGDVVFTFMRGPDGILDPCFMRNALYFSGLSAALYAPCDYGELSGMMDEIISDLGFAILVICEGGSKGGYELFYATR